MYNSSLARKSDSFHSDLLLQIPDKIFFNDMSQVYMQDCFKSCDVIYSEPAWNYGYKNFNAVAGNSSPEPWAQYMRNINKLIKELGVPSFIVCGKQSARYFPDAEMKLCSIVRKDKFISGANVFVWNYALPDGEWDTEKLIGKISKEFKKCLDFSCGYGEHLLAFEDFVGCDVNRECLTWLANAYKEKSGWNYEENLGRG